MLNDYMILALKGKCQYSWTRYSYRHDTLPTITWFLHWKANVNIHELDTHTDTILFQLITKCVKVGNDSRISDEFKS